MNIELTFANSVLDQLIELLDVPPSYYQKSIERYRSLSEWFNRPESALRAYAPAMSVQGSFRYGTVVRPLLPNEEFDLDLLAVLLGLAKTTMTQADLKELVGNEIKAYAKKHGMRDPEEKRRCWRLDYVDHIKFHMDTCPGISEDEAVKARLRLTLDIAGVDPALADLAIAITCQKHVSYRKISVDWPSSNPEGLARWFEMRMRLEGLTRAKALVEARRYATINDVPVYEWKTPLQRAIQVLKRHRDVMFQDDCEGRPISMIITTLSARAYEGEGDLYNALDGILDRMLGFVRPKKPRVENPVNPAEDFADKWADNPRLEANFRLWHQQARRDFDALCGLDSPGRLERYIKNTFAETISDDTAAALIRQRPARSTGPAILIPTVVIPPAPPRPWGCR